MNKVVYEHWDIEADMPFYIGMGDPSRAHDRSNRGKIWKAVVEDLEESGFTYEVRIVDAELTTPQAHSLEKSRIKMWVDLGVVLANKSTGGEGTSGYKYTEEQRARRSTQLTGKPRPDVSKRMTGVAKNPESVKKGADAQRGKPKPSISIALTGKKQTTETVEKRAQKIRGRKYTEDHCDKISEALTGREITWGAKISATLKGRRRTPESLAKAKATRDANKLAKQLNLLMMEN
jgi:hypothetical protein